MIYKKVFISVSHSHSILCIPKRKLRIFYCYCLSFVLYYRFHSGNNYVNFAHPCVCVCSVAQSCSTLCDPMNCHQAPLSMRFSSQEYWNGLPSATPRGLSNPGSEPMSPACLLLAGRFFATEPPGKSTHHCTHRNYHDL